MTWPMAGHKLPDVQDRRKEAVDMDALEGRLTCIKRYRKKGVGQSPPISKLNIRHLSARLQKAEPHWDYQDPIL